MCSLLRIKWKREEQGAGGKSQRPSVPSPGSCPEIASRLSRARAPLPIFRGRPPLCLASGCCRVTRMAPGRPWAMSQPPPPSAPGSPCADRDLISEEMEQLSPPPHRGLLLPCAWPGPRPRLPFRHPRPCSLARAGPTGSLWLCSLTARLPGSNELFFFVCFCFCFLHQDPRPPGAP